MLQFLVNLLPFFSIKTLHLQHVSVIAKNGTIHSKTKDLVWYSFHNMFFGNFSLQTIQFSTVINPHMKASWSVMVAATC